MIGSLDLGLKDKVAIIAGGGAAGEGIGNGRAASILLAEAGTMVMVVDRDEALATRTVEMITDRGGKAKAVSADLTNSNECKRVVDVTMSAFGRLDVLDVLDNNIGIGSRLSVVDETEERWDRVM